MSRSGIGQQEQWEWANRIDGRAIRKSVRESLLAQYQDELIAKPLKVEILRFTPPAYELPLTKEQRQKVAQYQAASDSTTVKIAAFQRLGVEVVDREALPQEMEQQNFQALIDQLNADSSVSSIIVQYPVPPELDVVLLSIAPEKDLDALSIPPGFSVPATSEGVFRLIEPFAGSISRSLNVQSEAIARLIEPFVSQDVEDVTVAVVGARGFVGRGVIRLLQEQGITCISIDKQDENFQDEDLLQVRNADIVVSATGQLGILNERHLTPYHRLVVDCGYVPMGSNTLGDVAESARDIPQNITPVPGGTGPIEMAILMERIVRKEIDPSLEPWKLQDYQTITYYTRPELRQLQRQWADEIYLIARQLLVAMEDQLQQVAEGVVILDRQKYKLIVDSTTGIFSVESKSARGELARFTLKGVVQSASGLTSTDYGNWKAVERSLQSLRQRQQNQSQDQER